ncbi:MAG: M1 family aminopeptidase, partial [Candidatus Zixiibacteriota bacterium]
HLTYLISLIIGEYHETRTDWDGIPITYYVHPSDRKLVDLAFGKTPDMMDFYSDKIGVRYPYEKYAQTCVHDFIWGGMENISATTMTRRMLHDKRAEIDYQTDGLVAHELAHQWWGDLLTTKNWNNTWLNEGFATYFDLLYTEHARGHDEFVMRLRVLRESYMAEDSSKYRRPVVTARYEDPSQMFDRHSYRKGALVLHMLRSTLGDELWWKGINLYATRHRERTVETADFRQALEDASGRSLNAFFRQWIFRGGYPEFAVDWKWDAAQKMVKLNVAQTQEIDSVTPLFTADAQILLSGDFGERSRTIDVSQLEQTIYIPAPTRPERVEFDPQDIILKSLTFEKSTAELIGQLSDAGALPARIRAAEWLADSPQTASVVGALARALSSDTAWGVRQACAKSLGENKSETSRKALIDALSDTRSEVRQAAAKALGNHADQPSVTNALQRVFTTDLSYLTQGQALKSLAKLRAPKAYRYCLDALKQNSYSEWIRQAAFEALVELEDKRGIDQAFKWSAYGRPERARTAAVKALGKLARHDDKRRDDIRKRLEKFLDDKSIRVRGSAVAALKKLGDSESLPALRRFMKRQIRFGPMKAARDAIAKIQAGDTDEAELGDIQRELGQLKAENKRMAEQFEELKQSVSEK